MMGLRCDTRASYEERQKKYNLESQIVDVKQQPIFSAKIFSAKAFEKMNSTQLKATSVSKMQQKMET